MQNGSPRRPVSVCARTASRSLRFAQACTGAQPQRELLQRGDAALLGLAHQACRSATSCSAETLVRVQSMRSSSRIATSLARYGLCATASATWRLHGVRESCRRRGAASGAPARMVGELGRARRAFALQARRLRPRLARRRLARVLGHHLVAVGDDRLERLVVGHGLDGAEAELRRASCAPWPGRASRGRGCRPSRCRTRTA